jgi:hypothetical protein
MEMEKGASEVTFCLIVRNNYSRIPLDDTVTYYLGKKAGYHRTQVKNILPKLGFCINRVWWLCHVALTKFQVYEVRF